ncbi:MAG: HAMP domain-containing histidine kinase [Clostridium sp.]|nr:HAMP domain-containing histidine kinase [Clostridium sp.]
MKLTKKLMLILSAGLGAGFLAVSTAAVWQMRSQSIAVAVDNYGKQMDSIAYAFSEIGTREEFENLGDIAAEAYLKYQFRRCYKDGYALLKGDSCLVNLTEYQVLSPSKLKESYMIQHLGKQSVLLMKREIGQFPGYQVLMTQDITPYYQEIQHRAVSLLLLCCFIWAITCACVSLLTHRALKPLSRLTRAAEKIGNGSLDERVPVESRDEIGEFARVFNRMTEKVEGQVEDLQLLLGALSHEIKTPVTSVIGYSDSLLHVKLSRDQQQRALEQIHHAGLRLERLSAKMLNFLGAYENEEVQFESLSVKELLEEGARETEALWREKGLNLILEAGGGPPGEPGDLPSVMGDRELLLTLLCNLIHNSVKASEPGGRIWLTGKGCLIAVRDEGCGIPEKDLAHVTEAFYMADKSRSRSEGGSGLGLALCERIARLHGMKLEIQSPVFRGEEGGGPSGAAMLAGGTAVLIHLPEQPPSSSVYKRFTV